MICLQGQLVDIAFYFALPVTDVVISDFTVNVSYMITYLSTQ